jgi:alpha/beta superfamily hydrolase
MPSPVPADALIAEAIWLRSGAYHLEGELAYAGVAAGAAIIAGPHPLLGGSMRNNVVRGLAEGLARRGVVTLRFNYRGVGASDGPRVDVAARLAEFWATSHVADEPAYRDDFAAAVEFLRDALGDGLPSARIGYSFGCSLLPHAPGDENAPLVLVAPTVGTHDYAAFGSLPNPVLVVASDDDFAAEAGAAQRWFDGLTGPTQLIQGRFDNHFFRGHEEWLAEVVADFLRLPWAG